MLAASRIHHSKARRDVNTLVGDYPFPDSLRPRMTPLAPNTKTPLLCADGGPRWSLTGPHSDAMLDRLDARYRPAWGVRTGLLAGLVQASLVVLDVDDPDAAPDWIDDLDLFPWRVQTPRGIHLYSWTGQPMRSRPVGYGDVKAERSYVVLSQPSGAYRPAPGFGVGQLPLWPESVLSDLLRADLPADSPDRTDNPRPDRPLTRPVDARQRPTVSPVSLPVGRRNAGLFRRLLKQAGRDHALRGDTARLAGLARWWNAGLDDPLSDSETVKVAGQASGYSASWETSTAAYSERQRQRQRIGVQNRRERIGDRDERIVAMRAAGLSVSAIARQVGVSPSTVKRSLR